MLPGERIPIFKTPGLEVIEEMPAGGLGADLKAENCEFTIDGGNGIWKGGTRVFAGLPTESEIKAPRKVVCNGGFVYAGLSTGELVKVDSKTRNLEWTADIFAETDPTGASPFLDIVATPVYSAGYVYAGGLGNAFCKIRDRDGSKVWCLPIAVQKVLRATDKYIVVETTAGTGLAVSVGGKVYGWKNVG